MKIVRLNFQIFDQEFFFDRVYNDKRNEQENCDDMLTFLSEQLEAKKAMAVMQIVNKEQKQATPAFINLTMVPQITIVNVAVYEAERKVEQPQEQAPEEPKGPVLVKE